MCTIGSLSAPNRDGCKITNERTEEKGGGHVYYIHSLHRKMSMRSSGTLDVIKLQRKRQKGVTRASDHPATGMMMIAFITLNFSSVPLTEGHCSSN